MVFTSLTFIEFFVVVLIVLALCRTRWQRQLAILLSSIFFYGYWNSWYLFLLATPSVIDYYCALRISETQVDKRRRLWLTVSVVSNLGLLGYFKYANFFVHSFGQLFGRDVPVLHILLPVGISFYTFKTMSYTIDVYRRHIEPCHSWWKYAMFVTYFPELVAGPIVRASVFLPQMTRSLKPSWPRAYVGLQLVALGFSKKLLVADRLAKFVDAIFAHPAIYSTGTIWSAVIAYSLQIYCDFSGYSDIAIGVSRIIGFDLPENFNMPYSSTSITEFWRRWHITLSQWLRDYLYIPLGGNRKGKFRTYVNLTITMLLGGLWHGANWTFVVWGAMHGFGLALHKFWMDINKGRTIKVPSFFGWAITYIWVCFAWVLFRAPDFSTAMLMMRKMLFINSVGVNYVYFWLYAIIPFVVFAHLLGRYVNDGVEAAGQRKMYAPLWAERLYTGTSRFAIRPHPQAGTYALMPTNGFALGLLVTTWAIVFYLFAALDSSPFIYFQF
jgi:alginate O-acetyltransferase complex protein AlgI